MTALSFPGIDINVVAPSVAVESFAGANDAAKIQAALNSGASEIHLKRDKTYDCSAAVITLPSGVRLVGKNSTLNNAQINCTGSVGSEVNLTAAVAAGDSALPFNTSGFSADDYIHVMGCINSNSPDGLTTGWQTGPLLAGESCFLAEFKRIKTIDSGSQATVEGVVIFPYPNVAGANSGTRTASTVRKVTFADRSGLIGINFTGNYTGGDQGVAYVVDNWTKDFLVKDCLFETGTVQKYHCEGLESFRGTFTKNRHRRGGYDATMAALPTGRSLFNSVITLGVQGRRVLANDFDGGYQCVDFTYNNGGSVSTDCICDDNTARNCRDGATTHPGGIGGSISNNTVYADNGIRIRCRDTAVVGNVCVGRGPSAGVGVYLAGGFTEGVTATGNTCRQFLYGIDIEGSDSNGAPSVPVASLVQGNTISDCVTGILATRLEASALHLGIEIRDNLISRCSSDGVNIASYANGVSVRGNKLVGPYGGSARAGIEYLANVAGLSITDNDFIDLGSGCFSIRGPSSSTMMTDATTFPAGEAAALLVIEDNKSFGTDAGTTGIIRNIAAFDSSIRTHGVQTQEGKLVARQMNSVTGNVLEVQNSAGTVVAAFDQAGTPRFGTRSAIVAETLSGYITITDAGGTTRKLAVVS